MSRVLHVVDISPCVYAGMSNKYSFIQGGVLNTPEGHLEQNIPTGGTSMLFNILAQYMSDEHIMFIADRTPSVKKEIYPEYKACRTHPDEVEISKEVAEYILADCGFTVYAMDGYEADDIIYTIVNQNKKKFDHIYVHTADSDLYVVVQDNVSILPTSSQAKTVTMDNYEYMCKKGVTTVYNSVVFEKFLAGDRSKSLPALPKDERLALVKEFGNKNISKVLGNTDLVLALMKKFPQYEDRCKLFYPLLVPGEFDAERVEGDKERIRNWAYEIRTSKIPKKRGDLTVQIAELMRRGLYIERI